MAADPTYKDLAKELRDLLASPKGESGLTQRELSEMLGWGRERTLRSLQELHKAGKLASGRSTRESIAGVRVSVPVYRLKT